MSLERQERRVNPYKEYQPGQKISFDLQTLRPNGTLTSTPTTMTIKDIRGGGFFGQVLIPEEGGFVVKTSLPDPWHHLWRTVNWGAKPFPAQSDELSAQLEHLATKLIHQVLPVASNGKYHSPDSLGYTLLPTGYAQVVEEMHGRGPRFDLPENEFTSFRKIQIELCHLALNWGFEQAGQIHPENPFGMANLWYDPEAQSWIWLDTITAIQHTAWVWPFFYFNFHHDVRRWFGQHEITFNRVHTGYLLTELNRSKDSFSPEAFDRIRSEAYLYGRIWEERRMKGLVDTRDFQMFKDIVYALVNGAITDRAIFRIIADPNFRQEKINGFMKMLKDPTYRALTIRQNTVLKGIHEARRVGLVTEEEWQRACDAVSWDGLSQGENNRRIRVLTGLQLYYIISGQILNVIEASVYASALFSDNKLSRIGLGLFIGWVLPSIIRPLATELIGAASKVDLKAARYVSAAPKLGGYLAVPSQLAIFLGAPAKGIWHYTVRNIIAGLSRFISPSGGWNSQLEGELWLKLGVRLERLGKQRD